DAMRGVTFPLGVIAVLLICGCMESATVDIPDEYYFEMKKADVDSPVELIRFAASIRPYTTGFTVSEKVAFFEWYLKNRGFNVNFAYSNDFRDSGSEHIWLVLKNKLGENMAIEPSYIEMEAASVSPTTQEYKRYQKKFADIYELSKNTGGSEQYAWWKKSSGQKLLNENVMLYKKSEL
ncbi:MAG: hypothetical protein GX465_15965, partial [Acidobacteria bacterium]|nr:hypothetical protein [Acidobacteriota bacterium]